MTFEEIVNKAFIEAAGRYTLDGFNTTRVARLAARDCMDKYGEQIEHIIEDAFIDKYGDLVNSWPKK